MMTKPPSYRGYRCPPEIISRAVWLSHRFALRFRDAVSVAGRGRGRRRARHSRAIAPQWAGGHTVLPQAVETTRLRASPADHGQAAQRPSGAPDRDAVGGPLYGTVREQPRGGLAPTDPPARAPDAPLHIGRPSTTLRIGARRRTESVPGGPTSATGRPPPVVEKTGVSGLECSDLRLLNERRRSVSRPSTALASSS